MRSLIIYDPVGLVILVVLFTSGSLLIIYYLQLLYQRIKAKRGDNKKNREGDK